MKPNSGGEGRGGRKPRDGQKGPVRQRQDASEGGKKRKKRVWVNLRDKSQRWKKFKKIQDVKASAALWRMRRREEPEVSSAERDSGAKRAAASHAEEDPDAFLQRLLDPLHATRKKPEAAVADCVAGESRREHRVKGDGKNAKRKHGPDSETPAERLKSARAAKEDDSDAGGLEVESESDVGGRCRRKRRGGPGRQTEEDRERAKRQKLMEPASEPSGDEQDEDDDEDEEGVEEREGAEDEEKEEGAQTEPAEDVGKKETGKSRARQNSSAAPSGSAVFYPFKKAMEEAARRKAEHEVRRRKQEEERARREEERKVAEARRRKERKKLQARTERGQPVMGNVMQVLLGKIKRREGISS
ncbi:hypothetical protein BESB_045170 [Besnoitia besnoiti]|uniref:rRNA processing protein n=1 Tax=Besnoitia besnoiti TaxID=94643 RepID=A0A2A9MEA9_BESBE|nr:hypothetical protein BESB_045170 [Besnoitia besnoiti]PFH36325.1 hypothetical protein BESB_045170 [Besnoitia besnoiti]